MSDRLLRGVGVTPLAGVGTAVWYRPDADLDLGDLPDPASVDPTAERERFADARDRAREELEAERDRARERVGESEAAVFDAHVQFLLDPQIETGVEAAIDEELPAEHAVRRAFEGPIEQFEGMEGRTAERADDLRDVRDRLLRLLVGGERADLASFPGGSVILADRLTPSDTARLDPESVAGFVTATGGRTSHAAIFARSLAIPAVVGVGDALSGVGAGATLLVDGTTGEVIVDPDEETRSRVGDAETAEVRTGPVTTTDGRRVEVAANVGRPTELAAASERGADGIGLFRTEFLVVDRETSPDEDEQYETYREALDAFPDDRVVVRTFDVGGDKPVPFLDLPEEENPFLGERGIRRSLGPDAALFETQVRALLRAAADGAGDLSVMVPLVATVEEFEAFLDRVDEVATDLANAGVDHARPELGTMVETPAATFVAAELAERADFLSIGTNDLAQYVMAAARGNERVADLHDPLHPPVLRAVARTVEAAEGTDAWVGMCGELAGDPVATELLLGLGLDELSASPVAVPAVKQRVAETDDDDAATLAARALRASTRSEVTALLEDGG